MKAPLSNILKALVALAAVIGSAATAHAASNPYAQYIKESYEGKADTLTYCLVNQFLNTSRGTFWAVPRTESNRATASTYIYWQQAHAMDVIVYSYQRIKDTKPTLASTYAQYMSRWFNNHANNWYHDSSDRTGFLNEYTDDMCWICLTMIHIYEALGEEKYLNMAKTIFDQYVVPRGWTDDDGYWGLPWKSNNNDRNACTNAPGCLVAVKLYNYTGTAEYLDIAKEIYDFWAHVMATNLKNDGRVEDPPLTYTQGTFGEACRQLYNATQDNTYMNMACKVIWYACSSGRCVDRGLLRHEGTSMDQSIFKAVLIPYAVNLALDPGCRANYRLNILRFLLKNADTLWSNLDLESYPRTFCNYYWGEPVDPAEVPSMGAMTSGASLMENVSRMALALGEFSSIETLTGKNTHHNTIYDMQGRRIMSGTGSTTLLQPGTYIIDGRKVIIQ